MVSKKVHKIRKVHVHMFSSKINFELYAVNIQCYGVYSSAVVVAVVVVVAFRAAISNANY